MKNKLHNIFEDRNLRILILGFFSLKLLYIAISIAIPYPELNRMALNFSFQYLTQVFSGFDSGWYEKIATTGYPKGLSLLDNENAVYAFFPAFPMLGYPFVQVLGVRAQTILLVLNTALSFTLLIVFYKFVLQWSKNQEVAFYSSVSLFLFPHHFYFSFNYSETLFLLSLICAFYSILLNNWRLFIASTSILVLTRINGIIAFIPICLFLLENWSTIKQKKHFIVSVLAAPTILFLYLLSIWVEFGDLLAFKHISEYHWSGNPQFPLAALYDTLFVRKVPLFLKYNAVYASFFLLLSLYFLTKRRFSFFVLCILTILIPLYEGSTISQPRFISVVFPFSILIGTFINKMPKPSVIATIFIMSSLHIITVFFWFTNHPLSQ